MVAVSADLDTAVTMERALGLVSPGWGQRWARAHGAAQFRELLSFSFQSDGEVGPAVVPSLQELHVSAHTWLDSWTRLSLVHTIETIMHSHPDGQSQ
jgi:hypothetical protein